MLKPCRSRGGGDNSQGGVKRDGRDVVLTAKRTKIAEERCAQLEDGGRICSGVGASDGHGSGAVSCPLLTDVEKP